MSHKKLQTRPSNTKSDDDWLAIHTEAHEKVLTVGCQYYTCRAINAVEVNGNRKDVAQEFVQKVGTPAVLEDVRAVRTALGNDAFEWMLNPEFQ